MATMMLGEVSPGGAGSGLHGLLMTALLAVFLGGLMVGRTLEDRCSRGHSAGGYPRPLIMAACPPATQSSDH